MKSSYLQVDGAPRYPFVNHPFVVTVQLRRNARLVCGEHTPIIVRLYTFEEDKAVRCTDPILKYDPEALVIGKDGFASISLTFLAPSASYGNSDFCLEFTLLNTEDHHAPPAFTDRMYAVNCRLIVDESQPDIFHNQRGGKNSCIQIHVSLRDHQNQIIRGQTIPVKAVLQYDKSFREVVDQTILVSMDHRMTIGPSGEGVLKFRIEEVSRNHQKQLFVIKITPDTAAIPRNSDIGPDITTPIYVKSRPTRKKAHMLARAAALEAEMAADDDSDDELMEQKIKMARTAKTQYASSMFSSSALSSGVSFNDIAPRPPRPDISSSLLDRSTTHKVFADLIMDYHAAMQEISEMQWVRIGDEVEEDGSVRPLYRMKNPNAKIATMIERYNVVTDALKYEVDEMATKPTRPPVPPLASIIPSVATGPGSAPHGEESGSGRGGSLDSLCSAVLAVSAAQNGTLSSKSNKRGAIDVGEEPLLLSGVTSAVDDYTRQAYGPPSNKRPPMLLSESHLASAVSVDNFPQSGAEQFSIFLHSFPSIKLPSPSNQRLSSPRSVSN